MTCNAQVFPDLLAGVTPFFSARRFGVRTVARVDLPKGITQKVQYGTLHYILSVTMTVTSNTL
jgi:hypothetical protein